MIPITTVNLIIGNLRVGDFISLAEVVLLWVAAELAAASGVFLTSVFSALLVKGELF